MKHKVIKSGFSFFYTNLNGHVEAGHRRSHNLNMLQNPEKRLRLFILQKCTMNVELGIRLAWKASAVAYHLRGQIIRRFFQNTGMQMNATSLFFLPSSSGILLSHRRCCHDTSNHIRWWVDWEGRWWLQNNVLRIWWTKILLWAFMVLPHEFSCPFVHLWIAP